MDRILNEALQGNDEAFTELMNYYLPNIYNYVYWKVEGKADAKDIIQEIMLAIYNSRKSFNRESSFKTWILGIARRKVADFYRKKYAEDNISYVPTENIANEPETNPVSRLSKLSIAGVINGLSGEEKELLNLLCIQGYTYKEVASFLQLPVGTVKSRMHNLKEKLRPLLLDDWRSLYE